MSNFKLTLNNNEQIPQIGLGTWRITGKDTVYETLKIAISLGYRHIDTALVYENEKDIGEALQKIYKECDIKREDLFITSKLWNSYHHRAEEGLFKTLSDLQTSYLDLYLIHWPVSFLANEDGTTKLNSDKLPVVGNFDLMSVYKKMEEFQKKGLIKSIGVANFGVKNLKILTQECHILPVTNQIELHPYLKQKEIVDFCKKFNITITAYSSLGSLYDEKHPLIMKDPVISAIAIEKNITPAQVILSYLMAKGMIIIPKSVNPERLKSNLKSDPTILKEKEILAIDSITKEHRYVDPVFFGPGRFD